MPEIFAADLPLVSAAMVFSILSNFGSFLGETLLVMMGSSSTVTKALPLIGGSLGLSRGFRPTHRDRYHKINSL